MIDFKRKKNRRLIILVSGRGTNMKAIINTCQLEKWPIEISAVISDCDCQAIQLARSFNIKTLIFDRKGFKNTHDFEFNLINEINQMKPSLIALAGFMRILSKNFCKIFSDRIINIHPSLLPDYKGLKTHQRVLKDGKHIHGATVHAVSELLDGGSVLCQGIVPVLKADTELKLAKRVMEVETIIFPYSVAAILSGRVNLVKGVWIEGSIDEDFPNFVYQRSYHHPNLKKL